MGAIADFGKALKEVVLLTERVTTVSKGVTSVATTLKAAEEKTASLTLKLTLLENSVEREILAVKERLAKLEENLQKADDSTRKEARDLSDRLIRVEASWQTVVGIKTIRYDGMPPPQIRDSN